MTEEQEKPVRRVSLLILGDQGVGRTFLCNCVSRIKSFSKVKTPLNKIKSLGKSAPEKSNRVTIVVRKVQFERCDIVLELRDLNLTGFSDDKELRQFVSQQVSSSDGVLFVYSVLSNQSFNSIFTKWLPYCSPFFGGTAGSVSSSVKQSMSLESFKKRRSFRFTSRRRFDSKDDEKLFPFVIYGNSLDKVDHEEEVEKRKATGEKVVSRKLANAKCMSHRCILSVQSSSLSVRNVESLIRDSLDLVLKLKGVNVHSVPTKKEGFVNGLLGRRRNGSNTSFARSIVSFTRKSQAPRTSVRVRHGDL